MTADICPYCRTAIGAEDTPVICEGCGTVHHADCYAENGGCTIFGCAKAPGDEPKLIVSTPELVAVGTATVSQPQIFPAAPPPPPPPLTGMITSAATTEELRYTASLVVPSIFGGFGAGTVPEAPPEVHEPRNRMTFILLGALLGAFGAHNFYAGYVKKGWIQLAITLLTLGFASPMSWMWAVIDICTVNNDAHGVQLES
ncbi:MAG TPA: NINE protein [Candidatus Sulfotelmatobacter sp.]|jgi:hypothetical protein